jgi:hypothetical protein
VGRKKFHTNQFIRNLCPSNNASKEFNDNLN